MRRSVMGVVLNQSTAAPTALALRSLDLEGAMEVTGQTRAGAKAHTTGLFLQGGSATGVRLSPGPSGAEVGGAAAITKNAALLATLG